MAVISLQADITKEQILGLLYQLSPLEKLEISNILRAEASTVRWKALSAMLPDVPEITMETIVAEVKAVRKKRMSKGK